MILLNRPHSGEADPAGLFRSRRRVATLGVVATVGSLLAPVAFATSASAASVPVSPASSAPVITQPSPSPVPASTTVNGHGTGFVLPSKTILPSQGKAKAATAAALPASVDLSTWAPPVGNQGDVGSCVSWTVGHSLLGWYAKKNNVTPTDFAPMYIYSQINTGKESGSTPEAALDIAVNQGVDSVADYGTGRELDWQTLPTAAQKANASKYRIQGYSTLFANPAGNVGASAQGAIQTALAAGTPVAVAFPVRPGFYALNATNSLDDDTTGAFSSYHEVLALGYDSTGILIENQWGTGWGNQGWGHLSWNVVTKDLVEANVATGWGPSPTPIINRDVLALTNVSTTSERFSGTVQSLTQSSVNMTYTYTPTDPSGVATGPATTVTQTISGTPGTLSFTKTVTGLNPRQTYSFDITASNTNGSDHAGYYFYTPGAPVIEQIDPETPIKATTASVVGIATLFTDTVATYKYEYGPTTAYGNSVSVADPNAGNRAVFEGTFPNLTPSTTYHYRVTVTTAHGTTVGGDNTLTTPALPTASVIEYSPSSGAANFLVQGTPGSGTAVKATINWGTSTSYGTSLTKTTAAYLVSGNYTYVVGFNQIFYGLTPGTTYHYSTTVTTDAGTVTTPDQTFIEIGPPVITSAIEYSPSEGAANFLVQGTSAAASAVTATLNWGTTASYGSSLTKAATTSLGSNGYTFLAGFNQTIYGLTPGTTYHYSFTVTTANGTVTSPDQTFIEIGRPTISSSTATSPSAGVANFLVQGASMAATAVSVTVNWGLTTAYGSSATKSATVSSTPNGYTYGAVFSPGATGLTSGKTYHYSFTVTTTNGTVTSTDQTLVAK